MKPVLLCVLNNQWSSAGLWRLMRHIPIHADVSEQDLLTSLCNSPQIGYFCIGIYKEGMTFALHNSDSGIPPWYKRISDRKFYDMAMRINKHE